MSVAPLAKLLPSLPGIPSPEQLFLGDFLSDVDSDTGPRTATP